MPAFLIPAIMGVVGLAGSILQSRAAGKSAEEQANLYNDWLRLRQRGVSDILAAVQSRGYDPFGPQTSTRSDQASQVTNVNETMEQTQNPFLTPEYKALGDRFRQLAEQRLASPSALPAGYAQAGIRNINRSTQGAEQQIRNEAARRGIPANTFLMGSPTERQRQGAIADFQTQLPLQERAMRTEDINLASNLANVFGKGMYSKSNRRGTTTTDSTGTSTMTTPPNLSNLANFFLPEGPMASTSTGRSTGGDLMSGLSQLYFSNPSYFNRLFGQGGFTGGGGGVYDSNGNYVGE